MISIRLTRGGAKKRPFYHVVAADARMPRDGRYIERLGFYNPVAVDGVEAVRLNVERIDYWRSQGAKMSDRVAKLVKDYEPFVATEAAPAPVVEAAAEAPATAETAEPAAAEESKEA